MSSCLIGEGLPCYGNIWLYITVPISAAIIGWSTNVVALLLTFWPLEFTGINISRNFCGKKQPIGLLGWQGIIPTKAPDMAKKCIQLMTRELFSLQDVFSRIEPETIAEIMKPQLVPVIHKLIDSVGHKGVKMMGKSEQDRAMVALQHEVQRNKKQSKSTQASSPVGESGSDDKSMNAIRRAQSTIRRPKCVH